MRLFVLAFVGGTLALQHAAELPEPRHFALAAAALLALGLVPPHRRLARGALLLVAGAVAGAGLAAWRAEIRLADALPRTLEGEDIEVVGLVAALPQPGDNGTRFLLDVEEVATRGATVPSTIALAWYAERVKGADAAPAPRLVAGQRWRLTVRLKRPRGLSNPHELQKSTRPCNCAYLSHYNSRCRCISDQAARYRATDSGTAPPSH